MHSFPTQHGRRSLAYAQAASFVRFLHARGGMGGLQRLLEIIKDGMSPDAAFVFAYGEQLAALERQWVESLAGRFSYLSLITSTTLFAGVGAPLVVAAALRRWWQKRRKLKEWREEERRQEHAAPGLGWRQPRTDAEQHRHDPQEGRGGRNNGSGE